MTGASASWPGFWGKWSQDSWLPLEAHCLDVALCFRRLIELPRMHKAMEAAADTRIKAVHRDRLAVLAMMHDLGKANRGFQRKVLQPNTTKVGHTREIFGIFTDEKLVAAFAQALSLQTIAQWFDDGEKGLQRFLIASWSHHGDLLDADALGMEAHNRNWRGLWQGDEEIRPFDGIVHVAAWAKRAFPGALAPHATPLPAEQPPLQHLFAGLVMLADWLGSSQHHFPVRTETCGARRRHGTQAADRLVTDVGLNACPFRRHATVKSRFEERFGFEPRSLQLAVEMQGFAERLWILEAETGSGKTETALHRFFSLFAAGEVDGLFFALPTRVAARNLYARVRTYVARLFPEDERPPVLLAVPGYAQLDGMDLPDFHGNRFFDEGVHDRFWAAEQPKRFLAATIAVGTVDQALLGVIKTRHAHLRLGLLARHLLVVDEVHASDAYMTALLQHLLRWHVGALQGHALLLSATLGAQARTAFMQTVKPNLQALPLNRAASLPYPMLWRNTQAHPIPSEQKRCVRISLLPIAHEERIPKWENCRAEMDATRLRRMDRETETQGGWHVGPLLDAVAPALDAGARVLVVLNTVARANAFVRVAERVGLAKMLFAVNGVCCPHHGRFAAEDRLLLDHAVGDRFGGNAPKGACLLVGTQTLEQSLDIDADFLITDLSPADVLLQRLGRLHRHARTDRPKGYEHPRAYVLVPEGEAPLLSALDESGRIDRRLLGWGFGSVYEDLRGLEQTRRLIRDEGNVCTPDDARRWVEAATHPDALASLGAEDARWAVHGQSLGGVRAAWMIAADLATIDWSKPIDEAHWRESGEKVRVRLGVESYEIPLDPPFVSPFGRKIDRVVVPGWMLPEEWKSVGMPEMQCIPEQDGVTLIMKANGLHRCLLRYSRFGLEVKQ